MTDQHITIAQIVAMSRNRCIGKNNDLPWHIPADLQHFKHQTTHNEDGSLAGSTDNAFNGVMVMGRKTFESMRSRPLPKRVNIVITRQDDYITKTLEHLPANSDKRAKFADWIEQGKLIIVNSLEQALTIGKDKVAKLGLDTLWVIGGGEIFHQALPITERLELTEVDIEVDGDAFYPEFSDDEFQVVARSEKFVDNTESIEHEAEATNTNIGYQFISYKRI